MRILIAEDDTILADGLTRALRQAGYAVDWVKTGTEANHALTGKAHDLLILDLGLPQMDGFEVLRRLRGRESGIPVLILTARDAVEDRVNGLDLGADDYLTKPFSFLEFRSRIHALIRRSREHGPVSLRLHDLEVDPLKHTVRRNGTAINLTPKEFSVLEFLLRHKDEVISRTMIIEHVWDYNFEGMSNVVDVFIASLRRKIDRKAKVKLIQTIHGVGYKISG